MINIDPADIISFTLEGNSIEVKIAVNTRLLLKNRMEGIARYIHETTRRMVERHPEVEFHFLFDRPYSQEFIYGDNVKAHVLPPPARHPILWYLWFECAVPRLLIREKIDAFFSGDMYMSLSGTCPTLYASHDLNYIHYPEGLRWSHLQYLKYYFPRYHRKADHIVTVSEFTKQDIIKQYGLESERISLTYNDVPEGFAPIDDASKKSLQNRFSDGLPYFLYVGSLHPRKNIDRLLKAFDHFKNEYGSEHALLIYGRKAFKTDSIFSVYNNMAFKSSVRFVDDTDCTVQQIMPGAMALCYPSLFEGFGIPILEAFHCDVPVLTSAISSMPEVAGDAAVLIDPHSIEAISKGLHRILDPVLRENLIKKARMRRALFSWDKSADTIFKLLVSMADRH